MSKPAVRGISGSRIRRKRAFETPSDEQTSVGVHVGLNCVYFQVRGTLIDEKKQARSFHHQKLEPGQSCAPSRLIGSRANFELVAALKY